MNPLIPGFFSTVRNDFNLIKSSFSKRPEAGLERNKVTLAAIRVLGMAFMAAGIVTTIAALPILFSAPGVLTLALGIGLYALGQAVFVSSKNLSNMHTNPGNALVTGLRAAWKGITEGEKEATEKMAKDITDGALLQPVWVGMRSIWLKPTLKYFLGEATKV